MDEKEEGKKESLKWQTSLQWRAVFVHDLVSPITYIYHLISNDCIRYLSIYIYLFSPR